LLVKSPRLLALRHVAPQHDAPAAPAGEVIVQLEHCVKALDDLQRTFRSATLSAAADGELTAGEAMARVDAVRRLAALAHHAWRSAAHLAGRGA
jgi:phosphate:Na+ symporter